MGNACGMFGEEVKCMQGKLREQLQDQGISGRTLLKLNLKESG